MGPMNPFYQIIKRHGRFWRQERYLCLQALFFLGFALSILAMPVSAQTDATVSNTIIREIERLRRDLTDIQRYTYRDGNTVLPAKRPIAPENDGNARLQRKILEIQGQIRDVTGLTERVQHDIRIMGERLDKLVADADIRLRALEGGRPIASMDQNLTAIGQVPTSPAREKTGTTIISSGSVSGSLTDLAPGQQSLGRITGRELASVRSKQRTPSVPQLPSSKGSRFPGPANQAPPQAVPVLGGISSSATPVARLPGKGGLPEGNARQQYAYAFGQLKTRNYDQAENALRAFVDLHPDNPLAGNAMYWMGETYYVRKQFAEAARIFLDAYQRFPKGNKAPDNLYKLAKSLSQISENKSACTTYAELIKTFPSANQRIISGARIDMTRLGCG